MIDILMETYNNNPLQLLIWLGILYSFTGLMNSWKTNIFTIIQILLLLIIGYINFNTSLAKINQSIQNLNKQSHKIRKIV